MKNYMMCHHIQSHSTKFFKISLGSMPPDLPSSKVFSDFSYRASVSNKIITLHMNQSIKQLYNVIIHTIYL